MTESAIPAVLEAPPAEVAAELKGLQEGLDEVVPAREVDRNLLIGTWNIRAFGDLTEKWTPGRDDDPKRNLADVRAIAEIISRSMYVRSKRCGRISKRCATRSRSWARTGV